MAEAFCRWDDEKTGINPFLPQYPSSKGFVNFITKYIIGSLLCIIRLPFIVVSFLLLFIAELLSNIIIGDTMKYMYWRCIISPLARLTTLLLGIWSIPISYGEPQKLRIRTCVDTEKITLSHIHHHDIIISNFTGYVQTLIYAAIISDRFAFVNNQGEIIQTTLFQTLRFCANPTKAFFDQQGIPLESIHQYCPLIVYSEGLPTNNCAVLQFASLHSETYNHFPTTMHLLAMHLSSPYTPASYLVGGFISHLLSLLMQFYITISITWIADSDIALLSPPTVEVTTTVKPKMTMQISRLNAKAPSTETTQTVVTASDNIGKNNQYFYEEKFPELIAAMIQRKAVSMGKREGFSFIEYCKTRGNKKYY